ncbi:fructosamine kinase family protein [Amnibacterium flavum]|uniref:Fructosamine kinase n=1 Tax=Amnibacterium flavum TaxID=2173173 RepID=A0A2V1HTS8_9MICO|nr:fructosamine kinase family protein [Amnibacterium flavum]PVZ95973.1 fructosamine kinase [Amnibacterium flavum]
MDETSVRKTRADAPAGFFEAEAAGLAWLGEAETRGGVRVAGVLSVGPGVIELERIADARPRPDVAAAFGRALAMTHDAGAENFGAPPTGWDGPCFIGRQPLAVSRASRAWGEFYAADRVLPYLELAVRRGHVTAEEGDVVRSACARIRAGDFDDGDSPSRLHGDLWNGNVLWSPGGVVLIDPAAHGGHRETDLAMLALFGCPYLDEVVEGYATAHPLRDGWRDRIPLHQLHPLAVHAASHGRSYAAPLVDAARATLAL